MEDDLMEHVLYIFLYVAVVRSSGEGVFVVRELFFIADLFCSYVEQISAKKKNFFSFFFCSVQILHVVIFCFVYILCNTFKTVKKKHGTHYGLDREL